jgi:hypothetical protein
MDNLSVVLTNNSSTLSMNRFEVYDEVCGAQVGIFTLKGGESRTISVSQDENGKGRVRIRNLDLSPHEWVKFDSVSLGDVITA